MSSSSHLLPLLHSAYTYLYCMCCIFMPSSCSLCLTPFCLYQSPLLPSRGSRIGFGFWYPFICTDDGGWFGALRRRQLAGFLQLRSWRFSSALWQFILPMMVRWDLSPLNTPTSLFTALYSTTFCAAWCCIPRMQPYMSFLQNKTGLLGQKRITISLAARFGSVSSRFLLPS